MRPLTVITALCATPAFSCPTADDLTTGIRVTESDGVTHVFKDIGPGMVEVRVDFDEWSKGLNHLVHGTYIRRISSLYDGALDFDSIFLTEYETDITDVPPPAPGLNQTLETKIYSLDEDYPESQTQSWGPLEEFAAGDCVFAAIYGTIVYDNKYGPVTETIAYLPDIGIGLLTSYADGDEDPEIYQIVAIEAVQ